MLTCTKHADCVVVYDGSYFKPCPFCERTEYDHKRIVTLKNERSELENQIEELRESRDDRGYLEGVYLDG